MYRTSPATQRRKDEMKMKIIDSAAAVFSDKGYHGTSVKDVVTEADISVGTFYFYFKSKKDLFIALYKTIVTEFSDRTMSVVDIERFDMLKNFTRVMAATLYMYERRRKLARIMMFESTEADPDIRRMEDSRIDIYAKTMEYWFKRISIHSETNIPDVRTAALIYSGSYHFLVSNWISSDLSAPLTDYAFAFCVYQLQALKIPFDDTVLRGYINEVLTELNNTE